MASAGVPVEVLASIGSRIGAWLIDETVLLVVFSVGVLGGAAVSDASNVGATAFIALGVGAWLWIPVWWASGRGRQSPGKRTLGIAVVGTDGAPIGIGRSILRRFVLVLGQLFFYVGWLAGLRDPQRQTWHDQAAHSLVVKRQATPDQPPPLAAERTLPDPSSCPVCGFPIGSDGRCIVCGARG